MLATISGRTILEEARNPTISVVIKGAGQKMELVGTRSKHARSPPSALSPVKLRQTTHETLCADVPNLTLLKSLRIGSCGVATSRHCVANLYEGELQQSKYVLVPGCNWYRNWNSGSIMELQ